MKVIIEYEDFAPEQRPRDDSQRGEGWTFETVEHDEMTFPTVIRATDAEGRTCLYAACGPEGGAVTIKAVEPGSIVAGPLRPAGSADQFEVPTAEE